MGDEFDAYAVTRRVNSGKPVDPEHAKRALHKIAGPYNLNPAQPVGGETPRDHPMHPEHRLNRLWRAAGGAAQQSSGPPSRRSARRPPRPQEFDAHAVARRAYRGKPVSRDVAKRALDKLFGPMSLNPAQVIGGVLPRRPGEHPQHPRHRFNPLWRAAGGAPSQSSLPESRGDVSETAHALACFMESVFLVNTARNWFDQQ